MYVCQCMYACMQFYDTDEFHYSCVHFIILCMYVCIYVCMYVCMYVLCMYESNHIFTYERLIIAFVCIYVIIYLLTSV